MDRNNLVAGLKMVDPARSDKLGIAKGFWFTGKRLLAYNAEIAISVPCKTEWQGSLQETLLPLLNSSQAPEVNFEPGADGIVLVKAGASKFKLNSNAIEDVTFRMPKMPEDVSFAVKDIPEFLYALKVCTRSLGNDVSETEFKGITFIAKGKTLHMFGWERVTMTHAQVPIKGDMGFERVLIPTGVVNQLLRITDGATELQLSIDDKRLICKCGDVTFWGRIEDQERNPRDFLGQVAQIKEAATQLIRIDAHHFPRLSGMLERACIITQSALDVTKTKITWADNKCFFLSKSTRGIAEEAAAPAKDAGKHPDVVVNVDPERMQRGLDLTRMLATPLAVLFANDDDTIHYFVSGS
jgi:hypothetical protein